MEMEFLRHEPCYDRILLVLSLDRQKKQRREPGNRGACQYGIRRRNGALRITAGRQTLRSLSMIQTGNGAALGWHRSGKPCTPTAGSSLHWNTSRVSSAGTVPNTRLEI